MSASSSRASMLAVFKQYDADNDGKISRQEFEVVMKRMCDFTCDEIDSLWKGLDANKDGSADYAELCDWLLGAHQDDDRTVYSVDPKHFFDVEGRGCCIKLEEDRAITLGQLSILARFLMFHLLPGCDRRPNWYAVVQHVFRLSTADRGCSFVELLAQDGQPLHWYVTHYWGEPVADTMACLRGHAEDRCGWHAPYWIWACANNKWMEGIGHNACPLSFMQALGKSRGMLFVVDAEAVCFTRVWCMFELFASIGWPNILRQRSGYLNDTYTACGEDGSVVGITDGYLLHDMDTFGSLSSVKKHSREKRFPLSIIHQALALITVQAAQATRMEDKRMLLNSIAGVSDPLHLYDDPPKYHPLYNEINDLLCGHFAMRTLVSVIALEGHKLESHLAALVASKSAAWYLDLSPVAQNLDQVIFNDIVRSIPPSLEQLHLGFAACSVLTEDPMEFNARLVLLTGLTDLKLDVSNCELSHCWLLALAQSLPKSLQRLNMSLGFCPRLTLALVESIARGISNLTSLVDLKLDFHACSDLCDEGVAAIGRALPRSLKRLDMTCSSCENLTDLAAKGLAAGISELTLLANIKLDFTDCFKLSDEGVVALSRSLPSKIDGVDLRFARCKKLTDSAIRDLAAFFVRAAALGELTLHLQQCELLGEAVMATVSKSLPVTLQKLDLNFADTIGQGLTLLGLVELKDLKVDLSGSHFCGLNNAVIGDSVLSRLEKLDLSFERCLEFSTASARCLAIGMRGLTALMDFTLNVTACKNLGDEGVVALGNGLSPTIQQLDMRFGSCNQLSRLGESVAAILEGLTVLVSLSLDFSACTGMDDASLAVVGVSLPPSLHEVQFNLERCPSLTGAAVDGLVARLPALIALSTLRLHGHIFSQLGRNRIFPALHDRAEVVVVCMG